MVKINQLVNQQLCCLTTFFNPAGYKSRVKNHNTFADNMKRQNVKLITIELAFGTDPYYLQPGSDVIHMRSHSVLWQKERMLNYAIKNLPDHYKYIAWVDGDIIFGDDNWANILIDKFKTSEVVQLFQEVKHLPPNVTAYAGTEIDIEHGIVLQYKNNENWLQKRITWKLPYATIGYAWAARREIFDNCDIYDRHVLGSNDNLVIDCCLNCFGIHHYWKAAHETLRKDMQKWADKFGIGHSVDYLPITIYHLFHGAKKYRGYISREIILKKHDFDPDVDIKLENNVYEWNSDKPGLHEDCRQYFYGRREDDNEVPQDMKSRL